MIAEQTTQGETTRHNRPGWGTRRAQPCPLLVISSKSIYVRRQHGNSEPSDTNTTRVAWPTGHMACPSSVESDVRRRAHRSVTHDTHVMLEGRHQYRPATTSSPRAGPRCMAGLWQRKHQTRRIPGCEVLGVELNDGKPECLLGTDLTTMWRVGTRGDPLVLSGAAPLYGDT